MWVWWRLPESQTREGKRRVLQNQSAKNVMVHVLYILCKQGSNTHINAFFLQDHSSVCGPEVVSFKSHCFSFLSLREAINWCNGRCIMWWSGWMKSSWMNLQRGSWELVSVAPWLWAPCLPSSCVKDDIEVWVNEAWPVYRCLSISLTAFCVSPSCLYRQLYILFETWHSAIYIDHFVRGSSD